MVNLTDVFGRAKVVLPVLHVSNLQQTLENFEIAAEEGADGVFLIHHGGDTRELLQIGEKVREAYPHFWIGVNFLGVEPRRVWPLLESFNGVWSDNAGIDERSARQDYAQEVLDLREVSGWKGLYFGGLAFKYQRPVEDLETAAELAAKLIDVPTTSGPGTGQAADITKIARIRLGLGDGPLAIASGVNVTNVDSYLPMVDAFLAATDISKDFHNFDRDLLGDLVKKVHSY